MPEQRDAELCKPPGGWLRVSLTLASGPGSSTSPASALQQDPAEPARRVRAVGPQAGSSCCSQNAQQRTAAAGRVLSLASSRRDLTQLLGTHRTSARQPRATSANCCSRTLTARSKEAAGKAVVQHEKQPR